MPPASWLKSTRSWIRATERFRLRRRLDFAIPRHLQPQPGEVLQQFLPIKFGPLLHQPERALRQAAFEHLGGEDVDLGHLRAIVSMEVGWRMVLRVHANDDPIEAGDLRRMALAENHSLHRVNWLP